MQNPSQTRVIDPILSEHARGHIQPELVGTSLFPRVPVPMYGGKVIEFGKESFRLYNVKRAPGSATKRITFGYEGKPFAIVPGALEALVPAESMRDATQVPGIDLASRSVNMVMRAMALNHEYECAQIALNVANYDADHKVSLLAGDRWTSPDSDPSAVIEKGKQAIADTIGLEPNTAMISRKALSALKYHPKLIDRMKYTSVQSITIEMLKNIWEIENIVIGRSRVATGAADTLGDVWGKDVWLGYVSTNSAPSKEEPSFGYTYYIDGHPAVKAPYWEENANSWVYGVADDNSPVLSGMMAGYLIKDAGAAAA